MKLTKLRETWHVITTVAVSPVAEPALNAPKPKRQFSQETKMRHATENAAKELLAVQDLEVRLEVGVRWNKESEEWKATSVLLTGRRYQRCLDELEGLIVSRMFELTKMNMSQTGMYILSFVLGLILTTLSYRLQATKAHRQSPQCTITGHPHKPRTVQRSRCLAPPTSAIALLGRCCRIRIPC